MTFSAHDFGPQATNELTTAQGTEALCSIPPQVSLAKTRCLVESFLEYSTLCGCPGTLGRKEFEQERHTWVLVLTPPLSIPGGSDRKDSACNVGDPNSTPGLGRSPGDGNGYPLQYSCLDRRAWRATVHGVEKSQT